MVWTAKDGERDGAMDRDGSMSHIFYEREINFISTQKNVFSDEIPINGTETERKSQHVCVVSKKQRLFSSRLKQLAVTSFESIKSYFCYKSLRETWKGSNDGPQRPVMNRNVPLRGSKLHKLKCFWWLLFLGYCWNIFLASNILEQ